MLDDAISTTMAKVSHCVEEYREKTISQIRSAIFDAQALSALEGVVNTEAEAILKQAQQNLQLLLCKLFIVFSRSQPEAGNAYRKAEPLSRLASF